jgi:hypothetical protein
MIEINVDGIEELLVARREARDKVAALRSRHRGAAEHLHRLTDEVRKTKSGKLSVARERDELLADGSPEALARLRELRTQIASSGAELGAAEEEFFAAKRHSDGLLLEIERQMDCVDRAESRIYIHLHGVFIEEAAKRVGPELLSAIRALRRIVREEGDFFSKLSPDEERRVLTKLKAEYLDLPSQDDTAPAHQKRAAAGR